MTSLQADTVLNFVEADDRAILYKARFDEAVTAEVVPLLEAVLDSDDRSSLLRALRALVTIGSNAFHAAPKIARLLHSPEIWVMQSAAIALACVSLKKPKSAVKPLVEAAAVPGGEKHVMFALIDLGTAAKSASAVFVRAFESRKASMRRLAIRGLEAIGADDATLTAILKRAAADKSKEVREYARKVTGRLGRRVI